MKVDITRGKDKTKYLTGKVGGLTVNKLRASVTRVTRQDVKDRGPGVNIVDANTDIDGRLKQSQRGLRVIVKYGHQNPKQPELVSYQQGLVDGLRYSDRITTPGGPATKGRILSGGKSRAQPRGSVLRKSSWPRSQF